MLTVAAVCVPGGIYNLSHVERLFTQVRQHLSIPFKEHVITESDKPGWFSKVDLFKPKRFSGRVLYLDLDSTVIGSLDDLAMIPVPFAIIKNFKEIKEPDKARFNSSVISWDAGSADHLYTNFTPSVMDRLNGDQDWISEQIPYADTFHKNWCVSYKVRRYAKLNTMPKDARVVCYHGQPKPFDLPDDDIQRFTFV